MSQKSQRHGREIPAFTIRGLIELMQSAANGALADASRTAGWMAPLRGQ
jgi:hypothetical protein